VRQFLVNSWLCFTQKWTPTRYIKTLHSYLWSFAKKTQPLVDIESQQRDAETEFDRIWEAGEVEGWEEISSGKVQTNGNGTSGIWCSACKYCPVSTIKLKKLTSVLYKAKRIILNKPCMTHTSPPKNMSKRQQNWRRLECRPRIPMVPTQHPLHQYLSSYHSRLRNPDCVLLLILHT
jgi:hypothetical protein